MAFGLNTGWLTGLNWWKYGAYAVVLAALIGGAYFAGKKNCETAHERQRAVQAEEHTREVIRYVEKRVPEVQLREIESTRQKQEIANLKERLRNATAQRPENPSCDLSDAEFNSLQHLIEETKTSK